VKELESKLELEQTTRGRLEVQITRLKEPVEKLHSEQCTARVREQQGQDQIRKLQRNLREVKKKGKGKGVGSDPEEEGTGEEVRSAGNGDVDCADRLEVGAEAPGGHSGGAREQHFGQLGQVKRAFAWRSV
jgi:hypothetical protein